jgi:fatty-acyl-CoA synthase
MTTSPYATGLDKTEANHQPLTPLSFLDRTAAVYPDRIAWVHGDQSASYREFAARCRRFAGALVARGIGRGDTVAVMAPNVPALLEAHYGVPMAGAVLNALNVRLDASTIRFILEHGEAKVLITDREFSPVIEEALAGMQAPPVVVDYDDPSFHGAGERIGEIEYEAFLKDGDPGFEPLAVLDEWDAISLNYTSGTTGDPKGVVYHHRGAFLNAMGNQVVWAMPPHATYLWTLPMFHCNGWCYPWTIVALAGTHVCLRRVEAGQIYGAIARHGVTHFCGAPIVLNMLVNAQESETAAFDHRVEVMTAASPPPPAVIEAMEKIGFHVTHVYGLTECYGPAVVCAWHEQWDELPTDQQAALKARQGVRYPVLESLSVMDPETMTSTPNDGETIGEVMMRGNIVMKGYLKNPQATEDAFAGGWFHTGDLGVMHEDGYIELKDRSKDIIISGGENISSIEIEGVLYRHPAVMEAAVVARPDEKWGETPCAFVELKPTATAIDEAAIIDFCRDNMARFKAPKTVIFGALPKTSTGKVQKFVLREKARNL